jgi:hypothetical protein
MRKRSNEYFDTYLTTIDLVEFDIAASAIGIDAADLLSLSNSA